MEIKYLVYFIVVFIIIGGLSIILISEQASVDNNYIEMYPYNNTSVNGTIGFKTVIYCPEEHHTDQLTYLGLIQEIKDPDMDNKQNNQSIKNRLNIILLYKCEKHNLVFTIS